MAEILVGKVRPDLTNNLTQTVTGNALDAVQGKVLDDKIGVLQSSPNFTGTPTIKGQTIATTEKTEILCTPKSGFTILSQKSYQINNVVYISFRVGYTNGNQFQPNAYVSVANIPINKLPFSYTAFRACGLTSSGEPKSVVSSLSIGSEIYIILSGVALNELTISGSYVLEG